MKTSNLSHIVAYGKANTFLTSKVKGEGQGLAKGQNNVLAITFVLFIVQTSNLSHIVAYEYANKFLMSKVKGQGHIKGQNYIFGHNFGSIYHEDFQLVSYCSLWKGK